MTTSFHGYIHWEMKRDSEGHREYTLVTRVNCTSKSDGPFAVLNTSGVFLPGSQWALGNDIDEWAFCQADAEVRPVKSKQQGPARKWDITQRFTTKPPDRSRCQDQQIQNPLLEPAKVNGSFVKVVTEATKDRFGFAAVNSAYEQLRGPQVEFDSSLPQIVIEQNVSTPDLAYQLPAAMRDTVNDSPLWGLPKRSVRLSEPTWTRNYYGQCLVYYTRRLVFDVNVKLKDDGITLIGAWDRDIVDEGTKVLSGHWDQSTGQLLWVLDNIGGVRPDRLNPRHFIRYKDLQGENDKVILDGEGQPYNPDDTTTNECSQCPSGSPMTWLVTGLESFDLNVNLLQHNGECNWEGRASPAIDSATLTLEYNAGANEWSLASNSIDGVWILDGASWSCLGPNTMTKNQGEGPATITLTRSGGEPGNIHFEYYRESNFLLLGIPITF